MRSLTTILGFSLLCITAQADVPAAEPDAKALHKEGSTKVAEDQDELSADVQQLIIEQTNPKVTALLGDVENIMDEATERLFDADTGGQTIAAQTEIVEKIHAAAKEKQQKSQSKSGGAMMDMMERMMGDEPGQGEGKGKKGKGKGQGKGEGEGNEGGEGKTGSSDTLNPGVNGAINNQKHERQVPKSSGSSTLNVPQEFRSAFDAFNKGAEKLVK